jgi:outer membrane protein OmpA-like peptidoglycan-associated protein
MRKPIAACALIAASLAAASPARACDTHPADIYFAPGSASLDDKAREEIRHQASIRTAIMDEGSRIRLTAYGDRAGEGWANLRLSRRRAEAVRTELARRGVHPSRVDIVSRGEASLPVPTKDGEEEAKNRVVNVANLAASEVSKQNPVVGCGGL